MEPLYNGTFPAKWPENAPGVREILKQTQAENGNCGEKISQIYSPDWLSASIRETSYYIRV